jgi:hypothetical protein
MKSAFKQLHHTASTHFEPGKTTQNTQLHSLLHTNVLWLLNRIKQA